MITFKLLFFIALASVIAKVLVERSRPRVPPPREHSRLSPSEIERARETLDDLAERVGRLEEERDFYRELLENPGRRPGLGTGDGPASES